MLSTDQTKNFEENPNEDMWFYQKHNFRILMYFNGEYINEFTRQWTHSGFFAFILGMYPAEIKMKLVKDDTAGEHYLIEIPYRETINF